LWREAGVIAEADGDLKYEDSERARQQLTRDRLLHEAGHEVVHFTWRELFFEPTRVIARIRQALDRGVALRSSRNLSRVRAPNAPRTYSHFGRVPCTNPGEDDFCPVRRVAGRGHDPATRAEADTPGHAGRGHTGGGREQHPRQRGLRHPHQRETARAQTHPRRDAFG
jgi:hypothetical protein